MNMELALLAVHETPTIALDDIAEQYLNLSLAQARRKAARQDLPFPVFKMGAGLKAPYVVAVSDLAKYIEDEQRKAHTTWTSIRS